jgi:hypothetical protein
MNESSGEKYVWIQTRDQSPTLWSHSLGEAFRSVRGAFTESWNVFVQPGLVYQLKSNRWQRTIRVGEFGLGAGTNWLFWNVACLSLGLKFEYYAIEKDTDAFFEGSKKWLTQKEKVMSTVQESLSKISIEFCLPLKNVDFEKFEKPKIFESVESLVKNQELNKKSDLWFHDPFGYDVNPEGYSVETLKQCAKLWNPEGCWGGSFACNKKFIASLSQVENIEIKVAATQIDLLKRDRLEFIYKVSTT